MVNKRLLTFKFDRKNAIYSYLQFTKPIHKLTDRKIELLTEFIYMYNLEKDNFKRESDAWDYVFNRDNRHVVRTNLDLGKQVFENYMTDLRKKGIIKDKKIHPAYNPFTNPNAKEYELIFKFNIVDE